MPSRERRPSSSNLCIWILDSADPHAVRESRRWPASADRSPGSSGLPRARSRRARTPSLPHQSPCPRARPAQLRSHRVCASHSPVSHCVPRVFRGRSSGFRVSSAPACWSPGKLSSGHFKSRGRGRSSGVPSFCGLQQPHRESQRSFRPVSPGPPSPGHWHQKQGHFSQQQLWNVQLDRRIPHTWVALRRH